MSEFNSFASIASIYGKADVVEGPKGPRGLHAQVRVRQAYQALFEGRGSKEDADIVFVDLGKYSGYLNTTAPTVSDAELRYYEGQRSVFGRIMMFLDPSLTFVHQLARAVAEEQQMDSQAGRELT